jgi:hypothetical protein
LLDSQPESQISSSGLEPTNFNMVVLIFISIFILTIVSNILHFFIETGEEPSTAGSIKARIRKALKPFNSSNHEEEKDGHDNHGHCCDSTPYSYPYG